MSISESGEDPGVLGDGGGSLEEPLQEGREVMYLEASGLEDEPPC